MASFLKNIVSRDKPKSGVLAAVAVISIGEMGLGVAKLLTNHRYQVLTNIEGRSENTYKRAESASIDLVKTDTELAAQADYVLSIVPPKDALATARRIATAISAPDFPKRTAPLYYLDLNAVSPNHVREISNILKPLAEQVRFIDGGIIGGAPTPKDPLDPSAKWKVPSMPMSGPHKLTDATPSGDDLANLLNSKHISDEVGTASGLKMCFASLTKGFQAIAVESFTTAHKLGVLPELQEQLKLNSPATGQMTQSITKMPPKAYRWVKEMKEIGETFAIDGGFSENENIFAAIAAVYNTISKETDLGKEITEKRKRGETVEDVAACMAEGLEKRRKVTD
ncbi:phosphogluconate dehydrogenase-like protein 2 [Elsinoe australis]|uniref:Phosphogluconate dehydrogenase-like protein 2 n=1 Tax=Elsinoe australis TaxID=40998 RepID=A0A4V6DV99_9PEZI|nr:phosphogluconate dehydrogenase-like protein 2 [Elsinoe australis]